MKGIIQKIMRLLLQKEKKIINPLNKKEEKIYPNPIEHMNPNSCLALAPLFVLVQKRTLLYTHSSQSLLSRGSSTISEVSQSLCFLWLSLAYIQGFGAMEVVGFYSSEVGNEMACFIMESMVADTLLLAGKSLACLLLMTGALLGGTGEPSGLDAIENRFPIDERQRKERPGPENQDGSDTEEDDEEDEDGADDQDDEDDEDFSGGEGGDDDDEGDPEDGAEANGDGGSDDDDDEDGDEDDDDEENDDEEEDEEEEDDQPPAKKRK